jgi:hypothetical protein
MNNHFKHQVSVGHTNQEKYTDNSKKRADLYTRRVLKRAKGAEWRKLSHNTTHPYNARG